MYFSIKMPELENQQQTVQKRQIAYKARIKDIANGKYVKEEGWQPNYIITERGLQVSRANIIATVVQKSSDENSNYRYIVLDDGSSKISVRSFESNNIFKNIDIGDTILLIGRPREFGNEKYILAEILKKIDPTWIKVRKLELEKQEKLLPKLKTEIEDIREEVETKIENFSDAIFNLIKEVDNGDGADIEEVISRSKIDDAEKIITNLLEAGELFEIKSGRLKVLE